MRALLPFALTALAATQGQALAAGIDVQDFAGMTRITVAMPPMAGGSGPAKEEKEEEDEKEDVAPPPHGHACYSGAPAWHKGGTRPEWERERSWRPAA